MYEALISSAISSAQRAEAMGLDGAQIALSCKVSGVQDLISVYRELGRRTDYALHLGLTEAGMGTKGTAQSARDIGVQGAGHHATDVVGLENRWVELHAKRSVFK